MSKTSLYLEGAVMQLPEYKQLFQLYNSCSVFIAANRSYVETPAFTDRNEVTSSSPVTYVFHQKMKTN